MTSASGTKWCLPFIPSKAARDIIKMILDKGLDHRRSLEYYSMTVGLICIYARGRARRLPQLGGDRE
jgi:hypothetical protein